MFSKVVFVVMFSKVVCGFFNKFGRVLYLINVPDFILKKTTNIHVNLASFYLKAIEIKLITISKVVLLRVYFSSFSAELFKVDCSMFKIGRIHLSCNRSFEIFG